MAFLITIAIVVIIMVTYSSNYRSREDEEADAIFESSVANLAETTTAQNTQEQMEEDRKLMTVGTIRLMFESLKNIGCKPEIERDGTINVKYQGENLQIMFRGLFARVWDPVWATVSINDPGLPDIREAVNAANFEFGTTVVLTQPDEDGIISLCTHRDILFHSSYPDNDNYVKVVLDSLFDAKDSVRSNLHEIRQARQGRRTERRPAGFTTPDED